MSSISVVIVTRNRKQELSDLLSDLAGAEASPEDEVIVVDNGSTDGTADMLQQRFPQIRALSGGLNTGAPAARNVGAAAGRGDLLVFLDDDTRVEDARFLVRVREVFEREEAAGIVAFRILDPATGRPRRFEIPTRHKDRFQTPFETSYFISAGCAIRRRAYDAIGGMDESLIYGFEELDFSYRAVTRGFRIFYRPEIWVVHRLSNSGRPAGRRIYFFFRNKIWISVRYLPWWMCLVQVGLWSGYFLKEALRSGRIDAFVAGLASGLAGIPARLRNRRQDRIPSAVLTRLRQIEGRLYY